jgi:hypothetical protein
MAGCGGATDAPSSESSSGGVFGAPVQVSLLGPFQGQWHFDFDRTMATWERQSVSPETIAHTRSFRAKMQSMEVPPEVEKALKSQGIDVQTWRESSANLVQDLNLTGHVATGSGFPSEEHRFFALHEHDGVVCGKAWHHEDRFDPGDMSKCHIKLRLQDGQLHLDVKMYEDVDISDPDLIGSPPIVMDAKDCDAPDAMSPDRNGWSTYVFVRSPTGSSRAEAAN